MIKGPRIAILSVGKNKLTWLDEALEDYFARLKRWCRISMILAKDDEHLVRLLEKYRDYICLDPTGKALDSLQFAKYLEKKLVQRSGETVFVIGGANGLPPEIAHNSDFEKISLSRMTYTHQMARLVLAEQVYRAFTMMKGVPYHH